jgi:RND superfamily putative drug exporter
VVISEVSTIPVRRSPRAVARFSVAHRWLVIVGWLLLVVQPRRKNVAGGSFANDLSVSGSDSAAARATMQERFPDQSGDPMQIVIRSDKGIADPQVRDAVETALADIRSGPDVAVVQSPYGPGASVGRRHPSSPCSSSRQLGHSPRVGRCGPGRAAGIRDVGAEVVFGGAAAQSESGPSGSEAIGLIAAMVVLLLAFGSLYAMVIPILTAVFALIFGLSVVGLLSAWMPIGTAAPVVAAMIGLGVGIDYALLIVTRHREGMFTGHPPGDSIPIAVSTAGRSVLVAGSTVIVALLSLMLIGIPFVSALGLASAITVAATLLAAVTLLPALLAVFGGKLDRSGPPPR